MKTLKKSILLLASLVVAVSAASCINDELTEPQKEMAVKELATVDEQAASMEATLADLEALLTSAEGFADELASVVSSIENHIADLKAGATLLDGTLATLERQKELAEVMAAIEFGAEATKGGAALTKAVASVDKRAESWLGKHFAAYYPAAKAEASAAARLAALDLKTQKISVEAILSDVEAGLRKDADKEELTALAAKINSNADEVAELLAALAATRTEVETEYAETVETAVTDPSGFDLPALKQFNSAVAGTLAEADNSLAGLIARVEACEAQLEDIRTRLGALENTVTDLNELLGMIQSVTFMSEFSAENAIAYYNLGTESRDDGKKLRNPQGTIDLRYIIRPASAAQALTVSDLWDNEVKVFGYYAQAITKSAPETFDFDITNVTADEAGTGIVTVTVSAASLGESFYFKETGAKLALSIATGKTDLTSKFVEIVPKDASSTVYVESVELSAKSLEIDNGQTADIDAYITPGNATEGGVIWTSSDQDVLTVTDAGVIEGKSVGTAVVTATTKGVDEWGNALTATCTVKVNPSIKIFGSDSVEEGKTTTLTVQSPTFISPEYITWEIGTFNSKNADGTPSGFSTNQTFASVDDSGNVSGLKMYYNTSDSAKEYVPLMVKCTIDGAVPLVLYHEIRVIAVQPLGISINGLSDADTEIYTKQGAGIDLTATIKPAEVNSEYFKVSGLATGYVAFEGYFAASEIGVADVSYSIQPGGTGQYNYFYPKREKVSRNIRVIVEPHWVTGMDLFIGDEEVEAGSVVSLNAGSSTHVNVKLLSDTASEATDKTVTWTSSNPDYVSVDNDGNIIASANATGKLVTITVTTSGSNSVPNGSSHKSVSFQIDVTEAWHEFNVGDYVLRYDSDGSIGFWNGSGSQPSGSTVVGIVIAKENPRITDTRLPEYCTHGIAMALGESSAVQWWIGSPDSDKTSYSSVDSYAKVFGYVSTIAYKYVSYDYFIQDSGKSPYGYDHTSALKAFLKYCTDNGIQYKYHNNEWDENNNLIYYYEDMSSEMVTALNNYSVGRPIETSEWYFPSFYEMNLIFENKDIMNSRLSGVGSQLTDELYWTVSECGSGTYAMVVNPITGAKTYNTAKHQTSGGTPVRKKTRFIFAF